MSVASFIAVDWGTTRLRAYLIARDGGILAGTAADTGVQSVSPGGFPDALRACCGAWMAAHPGMSIVMAGMVGSRNGWVEAPYARVPCGVADLARAAVALEIDGPSVRLVPGSDIRWPDGAYDVMRGEETQVLGLGLESGLVCLPGTHCKWVEISGGKIARFATFITGELYAAITASFVARLAETPETLQPGAEMGAQAANMAGGLSRALFQARTRVLAGDLPGAGVKPFLSALLIADEVASAQRLFGGAGRVHLVAGDPQAGIYAAAIRAQGHDVVVSDPQEAFLAGLQRVFAAG